MGAPHKEDSVHLCIPGTQPEARLSSWGRNEPASPLIQALLHRPSIFWTLLLDACNPSTPCVPTESSSPHLLHPKTSPLPPLFPQPRQTALPSHGCSHSGPGSGGPLRPFPSATDPAAVKPFKPSCQSNLPSISACSTTNPSSVTSVLATITSYLNFSIMPPANPSSRGQPDPVIPPTPILSSSVAPHMP